MLKLTCTTFICLMISCSFGQSYRSFQKEGRYGFKDENNKIVIAPEYEYAFDFSDGIAIVQRKGLWGYINAKNEPITKCEFLKCGLFDGNWAMVLTTDGVGMCNTSGKIIVDPKFDNVEALENGMFLVTKDEKTGLYIPEKGLAIEPQFEDFFHLRKNYFCYKAEGMYGVMSEKGELIGKPIFTGVPYAGVDVLERDTSYYFYGRIKSGDFSYMAIDGNVFIDGNEYTTIYGSPRGYEICESKNKDDYKVVSMHTGEVVIDPIQNKYLDVAYRPCDGWGYESVPFVLFGEESNCEMYSIKSKDVAFTGLHGYPFFSENLMIVRPSEDVGNSIYTWEGEPVASNVEVFSSAKYETNICPDENLKITQNGKIAVRDAGQGSLKFLKKGNFDGKTYFFGASASYRDLETFKMLKKNKKEKAYVYGLYGDEYCHYYLIVDGFESRYITYENINSEFKIKSISIDREHAKAYVQVDAGSGDVELKTYSL